MLILIVDFDEVVGSTHSIRGVTYEVTRVQGMVFLSPPGATDLRQLFKIPQGMALHFYQDGRVLLESPNIDLAAMPFDDAGELPNTQKYPCITPVREGASWVRLQDPLSAERSTPISWVG